MRRIAGPVVVGLLLAGVPTALAGPKPAARPSFRSYVPPDGLGNDAGEPTLGLDPRTGAVLFQALERTLRATGFDAAGPGTATWQDVSPLIPGLYTFDPILETDKRTGRTWTSQLDLYCSRMAYSDDDGATWTQVPLGCSPGSFFDHQSVGVGPFRPEGLTPTGSYPNAVYYCTQTGVTAGCGTSRDGGYTFGPVTAVYTINQCTTAHGHIKTSPDGMVYLPPWGNCGTGISGTDGQMGLAVSDDNGQTWQVHQVPGSLTGDAMHPSVDVGADGTVYYAWGQKVGAGPGGAPYAAISRDEGETWTRPVRLGADRGIVNTRFVTTVAGDGDRAAVAFLGSAMPGDASLTSYAGVWHLYASFSYDRGRTWSTVRATPHPVQVGPICTSGALCVGSRNLLDFIDSVIDQRGRVLVAIADGCPGSGPCTTANRGSKATIVRQVAGRGLLRRYDGR